MNRTERKKSGIKRRPSVCAVVIVLLILAAGPVFAEGPANEVETLLKDKIEGILSMLGSTDLQEAEKKQRIMKIIEPVIDFSLMAKLTLGKQHWASMSPEQRKTFVDLFVERLKRSYLDKTTLYSGQKVGYGQAIARGGKVSAPMYLYTKDKKIEVVYKFYPANGNWKVYDVEIDGVSFIKSYRAQFNEILRNGTVADLFAELRKPADS
ncbi:MAG: ABC transporter substrate-binding protein [Thermodesulfobacteriota bacterium]|nr:ABC transporter substrate-binding protein [Thermodesulfobacteriota bacterium]